jgi:hypothetical protein
MESINKDALLLVLSYLQVEDIAKCATVCKAWNEALKSGTVQLFWTVAESMLLNTSIDTLSQASTTLLQQLKVLLYVTNKNPSLAHQPTRHSFRSSLRQ